MVFHFTKATGDGGCKCCDSCEGEYDVLCYYATTGKIKKRQYHGHGAPGIDLGERRDAQIRPNRITVTTTSVIVAGAVSLTIASRETCGEATTINRGTGDYWYHLTAPSGYAGDPLGETWFNAPISPHNYNGKWNFSGEDYRFGYFCSKYPINGGDTAWIGWGWVSKDQGSTGLCLELASLRLTGESTYEWIACVYAPKYVNTPGLQHELGYGGEDASYDIGYTQNTPYTDQEEFDEIVDSVYPGFSDLTFTGTLSLPLSPVFGQGPFLRAWVIAGTGGAEHSSLDQIPWKGYSTYWTTTQHFAAFGLLNQRGTVIHLAGYGNASGAATLPSPAPLIYYSSTSFYWTSSYEIGSLSCSPGRGVTTGKLYYRSFTGWDDTYTSCSILFRGLYAAYAWTPIYNSDGTVSNSSENRVAMSGPSEYANGKIYCFRGGSELEYTVSSPLYRTFTRVDLGSQFRTFKEHAKVSAGGSISLMVCNPSQSRNLHRSNTTIPALQSPKVEIEFESPFGFCQGHAKVPYGICVFGEYLYALVCDDENMWDFRWLQKYRIGTLGLELIWSKEPEHEWQCFHSFIANGTEVWATVTASDQFVFSNPTTWIGYNIDDPIPL